jgi:hypothetical protein
LWKEAGWREDWEMVERGWGLVGEVDGELMREVEEWVMIWWREDLALVLVVVVVLKLRGCFLMSQSCGSGEEVGRRSWCWI